MLLFATHKFVLNSKSDKWTCNYLYKYQQFGKSKIRNEMKMKRDDGITIELEVTRLIINDDIINW